MANTQFWSPGKKPTYVGGNNGKKGSNSKYVNSSMKNGNGFLKKLGIGSGVMLVIIGIIALLGFFFVVRPSYAVISDLNALKRDGDNIQKAFIERDLVAFEENLSKTEEDLNELRKSRDNNFGWAKNLPVVRDYYRDSDHFIEAGLHGVKAGEEFAVIIQPFADAVGLKTSAEDEVEGEKGLAEAFAAWIGVMPQVAEDMDGILDELSMVGEELSFVDAGRYPENIRGIRMRSTIEGAQTSLTRLNESGPDIKKALTIIPGLLGVGTGEKRYLIIMQNNAEIRATGGFWTNYATFKINNALLTSDFTSRDMYSIDIHLEAIDAYTDFPSVPLAYNRHLLVERMYARDANISPDFPTAVDQFMYFYNLVMPIAPAEIKPVDGIFAIDTQVIKELLEVTGPVTVSGVTYTKDNVVLELEKIASLSLAEQANRKKVLGDLMEAMLINVFESDKNLWPQLVNKGIDLAVRKHILAFNFEEEPQRLLEEYNFAGRIVDPVPGDFSYVVSTNLGGDKTNLFVTKEIDHTLEQQNGRWVRTEKIKFTYNDAPPEYAPLVKRYQDWVRVYVPKGSELISFEGSEDETGEGEERNKTYFHGWLTLGPGETKEMTVKYYLPDGVVGDDGVYNLYIEKQPGVNGENHNVIVNGETDSIILNKDYEYIKDL